MGRIRGKRNRDSDRYWHERRKATQAGMIAARDLDACCFCGALITGDDKWLSRSDDLFCRQCGVARGLIEPITLRRTSGDTEMLAAIDAFAFDGGSGGPGASGKAKSHLVVSTGIVPKGRRGKRWWVDRWALELRAEEERERACRQRLFSRAMLWLGRDQQIGVQDIQPLAVEWSQREDAGALIKAQRRKIYLQEHPRRQSEMPRMFTAAQVIDIRTRYQFGKVGQQQLAKEFACTGGHIFSIVTGGSYKSAGGPIHIPLRDAWIHELRKSCGLDAAR